MLRTSANDAKPGGAASALEDRIQIRNIRDKLENWPEIKKMKFIKGQQTVVHLGRKYEKHNYKLGTKRLGRRTMEKALVLPGISNRTQVNTAMRLQK